ncbi:MAG: hypothetical protein HY606_06625 [Planctomycetes bacterium]|nr:hypothetical protein [Planctomycetota bacterium]
MKIVFMANLRGKYIKLSVLFLLLHIFCAVLVIKEKLVGSKLLYGFTVDIAFRTPIYVILNVTFNIASLAYILISWGLLHPKSYVGKTILYTNTMLWFCLLLILFFVGTKFPGVDGELPALKGILYLIGFAVTVSLICLYISLIAKQSNKIFCLLSLLHAAMYCAVVLIFLMWYGK